MGSHILGSRKRCSFFGIVSGSFQKVLETYGGVRKPTKSFTTFQGPAWVERRLPGLIGPDAQIPQGPCGLGEVESPPVYGKGGNWTRSPTPPPWCAPRAWRPGHHAPPPIYMLEICLRGNNKLVIIIIPCS